jgi:hypothetical protein
VRGGQRGGELRTLQLDEAARDPVRNLRRAILFEVKRLTCDQLKSARNSEPAYRHEEPVCDEPSLTPPDST